MLGFARSCHPNTRSATIEAWQDDRFNLGRIMSSGNSTNGTPWRRTQIVLSISGTIYLAWIGRAVRPEPRRKRIDQILTELDHEEVEEEVEEVPPTNQVVLASGDLCKGPDIKSLSAS